jgi:hypothetical protein
MSLDSLHPVPDEESERFIALRKGIEEMLPNGRCARGQGPHA